MPQEDRPHVLLVDRDSPGRDLARTFLENAGLRVTTASDGSTAWGEIHRTAPDVVVAEILIPGIDGLALCRQIRAEPSSRHVRVLILSMLSAQVRATECGADAFLRKPITEQTLVGAVTGLVGKPPRTDDGRDLSHGPAPTR